MEWRKERERLSAKQKIMTNLEDAIGNSRELRHIVCVGLGLPAACSSFMVEEAHLAKNVGDLDVGKEQNSEDTYMPLCPQTQSLFDFPLHV